MARLLIVHHAPTTSTRTLVRELVAGASDDAVKEVEVDVRPAGETLAEHINSADGLLLFTPANFGYMAGMVKDLFDRTFLQVGGSLSPDGSGAPSSGRKPFGLCVHGRYDTVGATRSVLAITGALPWQQAAEVLSLTGDVTETDLGAAYELGATLAALLVIS